MRTIHLMGVALGAGLIGCYSSDGGVLSGPTLRDPTPYALVISTVPGAVPETMVVYQKWIDYRGWMHSPGMDTIYCPEFLVGGPGHDLGDSTHSPVTFVSTSLCGPGFLTLPDSIDRTFDPESPDSVWIGASVLMDWEAPAFDADSGAIHLRRLEDDMVQLDFGFRYHLRGDGTQAPALRLKGVMVVSDTAGP